MTNASHIRLVLWKAAKAIEKVDHASIADSGLQLSEFGILEVLLHKGPLPISLIGEKVLLTSGSMTAAVDRLDKKGLTKRVRNPDDRRSTQVHLTDSGQRTIERAYRRHAANLEAIAAVLQPHEKAELVRLLKKIGRHAEGLQPN